MLKVFLSTLEVNIAEKKLILKIQDVGHNKSSFCISIS